MSRLFRKQRRQIEIAVLISALAVFLGGGCFLDPEDPPKADFSASPTRGDDPLTVQFSNKSTGEFESSYWNFGDGSTSESKSPTHVYRDPGCYTVTLTVKGPDGSDEKKISDCIKVSQKEGARFTDWWYKFNNSTKILCMYSDLKIDGYAGKEFTVGGYWFRKANDGNYYYVVSNCGSNVPKDYIGHQWNIKANSDEAFFDDIGFCLDYSCFRTDISCYYGEIKLYWTASIGIDPNSSTMAYTGYVKVCWSSSPAKLNPGEPPFTIELLSDEEVERLREELNYQGGVLSPVN